MCLAIPGVVREIRGSLAVVDYGGVAKEVDISLLEEVEVGDYVIVHVGYAISKLSEEEAKRSIETWKEALERLGAI
ncbi:MAG: HypC/HybG/HupF family hydrogenase formation chaperone [Euryarchaeota archaeon]|nr:HypC/HybG/HupF family hydrogenase formation chaperone [Euryarchaeota archaeon]